MTNRKKRRARASRDTSRSIDPANAGVVFLVSIAAISALVVLVIDHYQRVSEVFIYVSCAFLLSSVLLLCGLARAAHRARATAAEAEAIRAASVEAANYGVITSTVEGMILEWNEAATRIFGYDRDDAIGRDAIGLIVPPELQDDYRLNFAEIADGSSDLGLGGFLEVRLRDSLGRLFPVELSVARIPTDPPMFTMFTRSLTRHRMREEENRRLADIVRSSEDAIISVDLNGRVISWNRGAHEIFGYAEEEAMDRRLSDLSVPTDGGQELGSMFRRVMNGIPGEITAERRTSDGQSVWVTSRALPIRTVDGEVSGMSLVSRDVTDRRRRDAEAAKNLERSRWHRQINEALDRSDLALWGQPVYRVSTGEISHYELLLRMIRDGEVILPGAFLPYAEESDLISRIDHWVLHNGIRICQSTPVAINLSGRSVSDTKLGSVIARQIEEYQVDPSRLRFEITESVAIANLTEARKLVGDLSSLGCLVSLDDFGTGYGSFTYLKNLPVDEIKIDASFVQDLTTDQASRRVVDSLVSVARNFSMTTVAEGIEDEATQLAVRDLGIELAQGFHLGMPMPLDVFAPGIAPPEPTRSPRSTPNP